MDLLWHVDLGEMLGDLTVTTFLILLAASVVVVSLMVLFPLIDLAFEKNVKPTTAEPRHHDTLTAHYELWQTGRSWLDLRSDFLRPDAVPRSQLMSGPTAKPAGVDTLRLYSSAAAGALNHTTSLIKRTNPATQKDGNVIVPTNESDLTFRCGEMIQQPDAPPNPVETIPQRPRAA
jgi:hypothetical protein